MNLAHPESEETQARTDYVVNLDRLVTMVLKENQEYQAETVSTDYPASQDSKENLVHLT